MMVREWRRGRRWGKSDDGQAQQAPAAMEQDALAPAMQGTTSAASESTQRFGIGVWNHFMPTGVYLPCVRSAPESG